MKLYYYPGACSLAPHIILREGNFKFDLEFVDLKTKKTKSGVDFLSINPNGYVPVLERDDGVRMTETAVILQYLADHTDVKMIPKCGSVERYEVLKWLNFISSEMHKGFGPLFRPDTPEEYKTIVKENLKKKFSFFNEHFAKQQFVYSDHFSVADAYLFTVSRWAGYVGLDLSSYTNYSNYLERIASRPKVQEAIAAESN